MGCVDAAQSPVSKRLRIPLEKHLGCVCVFVCVSEEGPGALLSFRAQVCICPDRYPAHTKLGIRLLSRVEGSGPGAPVGHAMILAGHRGLCISLSYHM